METIKKHMTKCFEILKTIFVKEDDVERMAAAKQELRLAYAALEKAQHKEQNGGE